MSDNDYPRQSYRDLLQAKANGIEIDPHRLELWRREEELIRSMIKYPGYFRSCGVHPVSFEAIAHSIAWRAYEQLLGKISDSEAVNPQVLLGEMHRINPDVLEARRGQSWIDAVFSEGAIPAEMALGSGGVVEELKQHHRNRSWAVQLGRITSKVGVDTNFASIQSDLARTGLQMHLEAQSEATFVEPLSEFKWNANERELTTLVKTHIPQLDQVCGGGHGKGELCVIGGGTNHGKSYFAAQLAVLQASHGKSVLYISVEDPHDLFYCRTLSSFTEPKVSPMWIRTRKADPAIVVAAQARMKEATGGRLYAIERKKEKVEELCNLIRLYHWSKKVDMVIVDYLQAISTEEDFRTNRVGQVGFIISQLKKAATQSNVALFVLSQYARDQYRDGTEPDLQGFKYCGDIENEAELALLFWRDGNDVLHVKIPKIKWMKSLDTRFIIPTDSTTGWFGDWEDDFSEPEAEAKSKKK